MKILLFSLCFLLITGCAGRQSMYKWGSYDEMLYQSYKSPEKSNAFRESLEVHLTKMEQSQQKVAPGLYAELGTLYLQAGDRGKAVSFYIKERDAWPESKGLMETLITNIGKPLSTKPEVKS